MQKEMDREAKQIEECWAAYKEGGKEALKELAQKRNRMAEPPVPIEGLMVDYKRK